MTMSTPLKQTPVHAILALTGTESRIALLVGASIIIVSSSTGEVVAATTVKDADRQAELRVEHPNAQWIPSELGVPPQPAPKRPKAKGKQPVAADATTSAPKKEDQPEAPVATSEVDLYKPKQLCPRIRAAAWHEATRTLAIVDAAKNLRLMRDGPDGWTLFNTRTVIKTASAITFTETGSHVLVGDKFGDLYRFSVDDPSDRAQLLVGHVSMLLDLAWSHDHKYIITADRDEKIRVSKYPNAYEIERFCLGHEQLVTRMLVLPGTPSRLVSGGGDPFLLLWNYMEGEVVCKLSLVDKFTPEEIKFLAVLCIRYCPKLDLIAVIFENHKCVYFIKVARKEDTFVLAQTLETSHAPTDIVFENSSDKSNLWITYAPSIMTDGDEQIAEQKRVPLAAIAEYCNEKNEYLVPSSEHALVKNIVNFDTAPADIIDPSLPNPGEIFELHKLRKGSGNSHYHDKKRQQRNVRDAIEDARVAKRVKDSE